MNDFQGIESGKGLLKDNYPSAAHEALKRRSVKQKARIIGLDEEDFDDLKELDENKD